MQGEKIKISLAVLAALTLINSIIFIYRDRFQYVPYTSYNSLYAECDKNCRIKWGQPGKIFTSSELNGANKILLSNSDIKSKQNTIEKIQSIGAFIYNKFHNQYARPSDSVMFLGPLEKYKILSLSSKENMWCGDFAMMFLLFASSQNILCRTIEIYAADDQHVINECYVPEIKKWILVDVPNNTLTAFTDNKDYLNAQSFRIKINSNKAVLRLSSVNNKNIITTLDKNLPFIKDYFKPDKEYRYYYTTDLKSVYNFKEKIKRYLLPVSWYEIYQERRKSNALFYVKILFAIFWALNVLFIISILLSRKNYDRSKKY